MIKKNIVLSPREILRQQFKLDVNGYRVKEVDRFLDVIIEDYQMFEKIIQKMQNKISELENDNKSQLDQLREMKFKMNSINDTQSIPAMSSVDVLKRISQLERIVFGDERK